MPFCTQCGNQVQVADVFCAGCGARQATAAGAAPPAGERAAKPDAGAKVDDFLSKTTPQNASILCYIPFVGWVACIVMLAAQRFRNDRMVRFHAFQGLYIFVLWLFVEKVFAPAMRTISGMRDLSHLMQLVVVGAWVFMMVKTSQGAMFHLPILGELAERSVSEQQ